MYRSEAYLEGWYAHAAGWPLGEGHTGQYRAGWLARERIIRGHAINQGAFGIDEHEDQEA